ncbi:hypothetical protein VSDG_01695 [Cytospora chrysosperma]|uniref:Rhodopsin domain-containing protein n=1 Tax=Cytospora chrysosperma TaxID=252740 RepID=A0A423WHM0_CYTCH|nr:hypothetical protein VSDG_01695 [Valsa sordida]
MAEDAAYLAQYNGGALVGTAVSFLALTYVSVGLRTYVRTFLTKGFLLDDWLMLVSQAVFTVSCTFILLGVKTGLGRHDKALPQSEEIQAIMWQALATATYVLNMMFIKLSIGFFLLRLAVQRRYTYTIYITMTVVLAWSLALWFWDIFQCSPIQAQWDYTIPHHQCVPADAVVKAAYALSVMTIVTDWLYALMPIPMIWHVKMSTQTKATVVVILGLGIFASVATLIRLRFLADLTDTSDILYAGTDAMVWTLVEPGVAIVASSLVTIRPLLRRIRLRGFETTGQSRSVPVTGRSRSRSGTGGLGSRTNRSATTTHHRQRGYGEMPGSDPDDVSLRDLEKAYGAPHRGFCCSAEDVTVTSGASTAGGRTAWGGAVGITLREADDEDDCISPVRDGGARSEVSTPNSDGFVIEGETPQSPEESEHIQGLLTCSSPGDVDGRMSSRYPIPEYPMQAHR